MNLLQMSYMIIWAQKKNQPPTSEKKWGRFLFLNFFWIGISTSKFLIWEKKFSCQPQKCKLELCMSNGSNVLIYLSLYLSATISRIVDTNPQGLISSVCNSDFCCNRNSLSAQSDIPLPHIGNGIGGSFMSNLWVFSALFCPFLHFK